eukprot:5028970-Alexandrium_andersonii.AAC.1
MPGRSCRNEFLSVPYATMSFVVVRSPYEHLCLAGIAIRARDVLPGYGLRVRSDCYRAPREWLRPHAQ